ncbi:hypothetical protein DFP72DRAFT_840947 [Ephemerocybe angulata]|uniref:Phytocyanin domain-containing protein n=1 Tax=Ephemerocybe angulata TaxID=980116 RepID=A0A8H6IE10_9AGAR|nr:hypothetical protein DFP72DRAFT_840947 [Tulosesus angulatus]
MQLSFALAALLPLVASAANIAVSVGKSGLTFDPTSVKAAEGDVVVFSFYPKNHTVTQSSFDKPCEALSDTADAEAVDSGFIAVESADTPTVWNWTVTSTDPAWFFCAQTAPANHCMGGMVFAVNPPADKTIAAFTDKAKGGSGTTTTTPAGSSTTSGTKTSTSTTPSGSSTAAAGNGASSLAGAAGAAILAVAGAVAGLAL